MAFIKKLQQSIVGVSCGKRVVFHHVPKCGGTSIERALKVRYAFSYAFFDLRSIYSAAEALHPQYERDEVEEVTAKFRELQLLNLLYQDRQCVAGHCYFSPTAHQLFSDRYIFVTTLRDPVEFFISLFFQMKGAGEVRWKVDLSFSEFLSTPLARRYGEFYSLYFSGLPPTDNNLGTRGVSLAKENLSKFAAVGFVHEMPRFTKKLEELLGVRLWIGHANKSLDSKSMRAQLDPCCRRKIEELSAANIEIYEFAKRELSL